MRLDVDTLHIVTKIRLLSDVGEANTCSSVSKTIHKRGCVAPYLELMLDPLFIHISICLRTVFLVYVCVVLLCSLRSVFERKALWNGDI